MTNSKDFSTVVSFAIKCGETTCASEPEKFCRFVARKNLGKTYICCLFPSDEAPYTELEDEGGWLQRCSACMSSEHPHVNVDG